MIPNGDTLVTASKGEVAEETVLKHNVLNCAKSENSILRHLSISKGFWKL